MPRNKIPRTILNKPKAIFYKPQGICLSKLEIVKLANDEFEAIKLHDFDDLSQIESARSMKISQPTFGRILNKAYRKISRAFFEGKAIMIEIPEKNSLNLNKDIICDICGNQCLSKN